jgi:flagellar hook-length control protein FliK
MKMRLHPAELGTVEIRLERNDAGVLDAHFKTGNDAARDLLAKSLDQLRESLQNAGWQIGRMEISSSPFSAGDSQNQKDPQQRSETPAQNSAAAGFAGSSNIADDPARQPADRLVSLRA